MLKDWGNGGGGRAVLSHTLLVGTPRQADYGVLLTQFKCEVIENTAVGFPCWIAKNNPLLCIVVQCPVKLIFSLDCVIFALYWLSVILLYYLLYFRSVLRKLADKPSFCCFSIIAFSFKGIFWEIHSSACEVRRLILIRCP